MINCGYKQLDKSVVFSAGAAAALIRLVGDISTRRRSDYNGEDICSDIRKMHWEIYYVHQRCSHTLFLDTLYGRHQAVAWQFAATKICRQT